MYINNNKLQEIRIKINKPCILYFDKEEKIIDYIVTSEEMKLILQRIMRFSLYAYEEQIKLGYITIEGGHRVGLAGECVVDENKIKTIKNISCINIRICKEVVGCSNKVMKYISNSNYKLFNTLIASPPGCGKTTLLRDIARSISDDMKKKVTVIDERSEIAASYLGVPSMHIGMRTDILDNCLKSKGMIMSTRSLSPDVIVCDELGLEDDFNALISAYNYGIKIITSVHAYDISDVIRRKEFKMLIDENVIERIVVLSDRVGPGTVENIYIVNGGNVKKIC